MYPILRTLINRLDSPAIDVTNVIPWASPIQSFGDLSRARVATLGINPSNLEFVGKQDKELEGQSRRFHTLKSLEIASWSEVQTRHLELIQKLCCEYFGPCGNPYDRWFKPLDELVKGARASYYDASSPACHLDLVPYATNCKWSALTAKQKRTLLSLSGDALGLLLRDSPVRILILNGGRVVEEFQKLNDTGLESREMPGWALNWKSRRRRGIAYRGVVESLSGIDLGHRILVLGFSHNRQGTPGVTNEVAGSIREWIARASVQKLQ